MKALDYFYEEYISNVVDWLTDVVDWLTDVVDWLTEFGESFVCFIYSVINGVLFIALLVTIPIWILPYKLSKKNNKAVNK